MSTEQEKAHDEKQRIWNELETADATGVEAPAPEATGAPAPAAAPAEAPAAAAPATAAADAPAADDPYAGLHPVLKDEIAGMKAKLDAQANQLRSASGHIGGLTSQLKELKAAKDTAKASGGDAPSADQLRKAQGDAGAMAKLKEDYPQFGEALDAALEERLAAVKEQFKAPAIDGKVLTRDEFKDFQVESKHPGWKEKVTTNEFRGWLDGQPPEVRNLGASESPQDAIRLLDLHKQARTTSPQQDKEQQRLAAAAAIPTGRAPAGARMKPVEEMTKAEYWAYLEQQDAEVARRAAA